VEGGYLRKSFYFAKEEWSASEEQAKVMGMTLEAFIKMIIRRTIDRREIMARIKHLLEGDEELAKSIYEWLNLNSKILKK